MCSLQDKGAAHGVKGRMIATSSFPSSYWLFLLKACYLLLLLHSGLISSWEPESEQERAGMARAKWA